jgi:CNT family concentrative nucleoside transporter
MALIFLINGIVGYLGTAVGLPDLSLQAILGTLLRPLAWVMGVPWIDTAYVGGLLGMKTVLNEFVAFGQLAADLKAGVPELHVRSRVIASYAVVGFANLSSIAIQIGGIGGMAPERRGDIARYGLRAMIAGNLAAFMSACWAGILL